MCVCIISTKFRSQGKGKNLILLKLHADFVRDLWLREAAKTHSALVAVQGFIQEKFSILVYPGKKVGLFLQFNYLIYLNLFYQTSSAVYIFFSQTNLSCSEESDLKSLKQRKGPGQRKRKSLTLHFVHIQV